MTESIRPALTPEEWARQVSTGPDGSVEIVVDFGGLVGPHRVVDDPKARHALAALSLHGQPFGFTREDVAMLRSLASDAGLQAEPVILHLAARIEALLPPEAK